MIFNRWTTVLFVAMASCISLGAVRAEEFPTPISTSASHEGTQDDCESTTHIYEVRLSSLLDAFEHIKKCAPSEESHKKLDVYVSGIGGDVIPAMLFFDLMRTGPQHLSARVRFIAAGFIASSSNIVWLAAEERVAMPGTQFLLHRLRINVDTEDPEVYRESKEIDVRTYTNAVLLAAGKDAADLWESCFTGKRSGTVFDGSEAMKNGWATKLEKYK